MNYICTWFCEDNVGEESFFPQTGLRSSSSSHKNIYWKCIAAFFISSVKFHSKEKHILFTNARNIPNIDGCDIGDLLNELGVIIHCTPFNFKTPKGYYRSFQNQFYEFSILEYIEQNFTADDDLFLIADSDCVFTKSSELLFQEASDKGFLSFNYPCDKDEIINGLSRRELQRIYSELLNKDVEELPEYFLGEFLIVSLANVRIFSSDFKALWPILLDRHKNGQKKFNEEAHTLSFIYYKNGLQPSCSDNLMERIWTNPFVYRNVRPGNSDVILWHLPGEKGFGFEKFWKEIAEKGYNFFIDMPENQFRNMLQHRFSISHVPLLNFINYALKTNLNRIQKRIKQYF